MKNIDWDELIDDIEEQSAVLLLGHEFLPEAQSQLAHLLSKKLNDQLIHAYERDGLFLFSDARAKTLAQKEAARFYRKIEIEASFLKKIVEMPFRLMVSVNPDKTLLDAFAQYRIPCQFGYYSSRPKERHYDIERSHRDKPLLYNLCGSYEDRDSLLLDYDDLFFMLKNLLADFNVPTELRSSLQKTTTYIFVGFPFERWYTQLFMRYLNMYDSRFANNSTNYVLKTTFSNADAQQFFLEQFNVKYIGTDWEVFHELHRRFSEKYPDSLRQLVDTLSPTATTVVQLIEKADFLATFQLIKAFAAQLSEEDQTLLSLTESQYSSLQQERERTLQEHYNVEMAKVKHNLLYLARQL